jgi:spore coat-associated protein N
MSTVPLAPMGTDAAPHPRPSTRLRLLLAATAALATAAGAAGLGTLAAGYGSGAASGGLSVSTGSVTIGAGTDNTLTTAVTGLEPGDTSYRLIDLKSTTTLLLSVTLATTDTYGGTRLSTAGTGLQMTVDRCANAWTPGGTTPALTYTCGVGSTNLIASRNVLTTALSLTGLDALSSGATLPTTDHLRISLALPTSSPNSDQGAQSIINYSFTGVQLTPPKKAR